MSDAAQRARGRGAWWHRLLPWLLSAVIAYFVWKRVAFAAASEGLAVGAYMRHVLEAVHWLPWLALMIPYSLLFLFVDTLVLWRVITWFNAPIRFRDVLPVRASSYIISIVNEQVGKGAIALYMNRRYGIPGWEVGSSMLFVMFCEFFYLLFWATLGYFLSGSAAPPAFEVIPWVAAAALGFFLVFTEFFAGRLGARSSLRDRPFFAAFRRARRWQYGALILLRSPAMIVAIGVYTVAARLFGVDVDLRTMAAYLPVIFFGAAAPVAMRAGAIALWVMLFPAFAGQVTTFSLLQHNFFVFFNAAIGLVFLRRAYRALSEGPAPAAT